MGRRARGRAAWATFALGKLAEGFNQGLKEKQALEQLIAERELKKQELAITQNKARNDAFKTYADLMSPTATMDAQGNMTLNEAPTGVSYDPQAGLISASPDAKFGIKRVFSAPRPTPSTTVPRGKDKNGNAVFANASSPTGFMTADGTPVNGNEIQPVVAPTLPAGEVAQTANLDVLQTTLDQMKTNKDGSFIGPVASRLGKLKQYSGLTASTEAGKFYGAATDLRNQLIYLRSGKQINESEYVRLLASLPDEAKSPQDYDAKLENFQQIYNSIRESRQKGFQQAGFRNQGAPTAPQQFSDEDLLNALRGGK